MITKSAVKVYAEENKLHPLIQPSNLKDPVFISNLKSLNADIFVVVAFRMLPQEVWKIPRLGTINLHASLLPDYRGAAPINHAIINGETITGVTTFFIDEKIDTGNILLREEVHISPSENAGDLHDKLMKAGARLMIKTISGLAGNKIHPLPQAKLTEKGGVHKLAPKIQSSDCIINWNNDAVKIHNFIRGLSPYPTARSSFRNDSSTILFKIFESRPEIEEHTHKPGSIISDGKTFIRISCNGGYLNILNLQLEGKKRMNTKEFLSGFRISKFTIAANLPA
jgi:methionyl-tRNA formyltransferase